MRRDLHVHSVPTRTEHARTLIEIVAILAAGIWAIYTFVYEQRVKPLSEPPSFAVPTEVEQGPTINGTVFLTIHKRFENNGNLPIDVAAEALSVYGEALTPNVKSLRASNTPTHKEASYDIPRSIVKLIYTSVKLRRGAVNGNQHIAFVLLPHTSAVEDFLIAIPAKKYPAILVSRKDYIGKDPISPKMAVRIVGAPMHAYDLDSDLSEGEFDSEEEFAIKP